MADDVPLEIRVTLIEAVVYGRSIIVLLLESQPKFT